jgi:hypothetical protein
MRGRKKEPGTKPITLVVPTSLQMGWVKSPPYFCAASETTRDIATEYCETPVGSLAMHKFVHHITGIDVFQALPANTPDGRANGFLYALEVYIDDFVSIIIPTSHEQLIHVAMAIMSGIHNVFPANLDLVISIDPITQKKLLKGKGQYALIKTILGFDFDGQECKTLWLEEEKLPWPQRFHLVIIFFHLDVFRYSIFVSQDSHILY